jgi:hypothetical protein
VVVSASEHVRTRGSYGKEQFTLRSSRPRYTARPNLETAYRSLEKAGYDVQITSLVMEGAELRVRADLAWLEHIERKLLRAS